METASLVLACIGILATGGVAWYVYNRTNAMTAEMKNFLVTLIINSAPDPKTLQRLLQDVMKTGEWRGAVEKDPNISGNYRIAWNPQSITTLGIKSEESVGKPTLLQQKPKDK